MGKMVDRDRVIREFRAYTSFYNIEDPKVRLKVEHTGRVAEISERIAAELGLCKTDVDLSWLNGMLHDIGRFEQVRRYGTFIDAASVNHAQLGADILFREGLIRRFLPEAEVETDRLVEKAVRLHNLLELPEDLTEREILFCRILRDADKVDILRIMGETSFEEIYDLPWEKVLEARISDEVFADVMEGRTVNRAHSRTPIDIRISHIALANGLVFPVSRAIVREQGSLERLLDIRSKVPETRERLERIRERVTGEGQ